MFILLLFELLQCEICFYSKGKFKNKKISSGCCLTIVSYNLVALTVFLNYILTSFDGFSKDKVTN